MKSHSTMKEPDASENQDIRKRPITYKAFMWYEFSGDFEQGKRDCDCSLKYVKIKQDKRDNFRLAELKIVQRETIKQPVGKTASSGCTWNMRR